MTVTALLNYFERARGVHHRRWHPDLWCLKQSRQMSLPCTCKPQMVDSSTQIETGKTTINIKPTSERNVDAVVTDENKTTSHGSSGDQLVPSVKSFTGGARLATPGVGFNVTDPVGRIVDVLATACELEQPADVDLPMFHHMVTLKQHIQSCENRCHGLCVTCRRLISTCVFYNNFGRVTGTHSIKLISWYLALQRRMNFVRRYLGMSRVVMLARPASGASPAPAAAGMGSVGTKKGGKAKVDHVSRVPNLHHSFTVRQLVHSNRDLMCAIKSSDVLVMYRNLRNVKLPQPDLDHDIGHRKKLTITTIARFLHLWCRPGNPQRKYSFKKLLQDFPALKATNKKMEECMVGRTPYKRFVGWGKLKKPRPVLKLTNDGFLPQFVAEESSNSSSRLSSESSLVEPLTASTIDDAEPISRSLNSSRTSLDTDDSSSLIMTNNFVPIDGKDHPPSAEAGTTQAKSVMQLHSDSKRWMDELVNQLERVVDKENDVSEKHGVPQDENLSIQEFLESLQQMEYDVEFQNLDGEVSNFVASDRCDICEGDISVEITPGAPPFTFRELLQHVTIQNRILIRTDNDLKIRLCTRHMNEKREYEYSVMDETRVQLIAVLQQKELDENRSKVFKKTKDKLIAALKKSINKPSRSLIVPSPPELDLAKENSSQENASRQHDHAKEPEQSSESRKNNQPRNNQKRKQKKNAKTARVTRKSQRNQRTAQASGEPSNQVTKKHKVCERHRQMEQLVEESQAIYQAAIARLRTRTPCCVGSSKLLPNTNAEYVVLFESPVRINQRPHSRHYYKYPARTCCVRFLFSPNWYSDLDMTREHDLKLVIRQELSTQPHLKPPETYSKMGLPLDMAIYLFKKELGMIPFTGERHRNILLLLLTSKELMNLAYRVVQKNHKDEAALITSICQMRNQTEDLLYERQLLIDALDNYTPSTKPAVLNKTAVEFVYAALARLTLRKSVPAESKPVITYDLPAVLNSDDDRTEFSDVEVDSDNERLNMYPDRSPAKFRQELFEHYMNVEILEKRHAESPGSSKTEQGATAVASNEAIASGLLTANEVSKFTREMRDEVYRCIQSNFFANSPSKAAMMSMLEKPKCTVLFDLQRKKQKSNVADNSEDSCIIRNKQPKSAGGKKNNDRVVAGPSGVASTINTQTT